MSDSKAALGRPSLTMGTFEAGSQHRLIWFAVPRRARWANGGPPLISWGRYIDTIILCQISNDYRRPRYLAV
jgi:hypothetical protein